MLLFGEGGTDFSIVYIIWDFVFSLADSILQNKLRRPGPGTRGPGAPSLQAVRVTIGTARPALHRKPSNPEMSLTADFSDTSPSRPHFELICLPLQTAATPLAPATPQSGTASTQTPAESDGFGSRNRGRYATESWRCETPAALAFGMAFSGQTQEHIR
jgi:hypothetical protein